MFGKMYRAEETVDTVFASWKKACNVIVNQLTENSVEGADKVFKPGTVAEIGEILNKEIHRQSEIGELEEMDKFWMISILSQTRILPPPGKQATIDKTKEYLLGLSSVPPDIVNLGEDERWIPRQAFDAGKMEGIHFWSKKHYQGALDMGKIVGRDIAVRAQTLSAEQNIPFKAFCEQRKSYHDSLSSSSSWESSREGGGKFATFYTEDGDFRKFLETPVCELYELNNDHFLDTWENKICSAEDGHNEFWRIAYLDMPLTGMIGEVITPGYLKDGEEAFATGVDSRFGSLLFEWARHCHANWMKQYDPDRSETYPKGKVSIVKEPGVKIRPVTAGETWVNVFLSPAGHTCRKLMEILPACRVGLSDTNGLYRLSEEYKADIRGTDQISTSDMTSATDRARHDVSFGLLNGLFKELFSQRVITKGEKIYLQQAAALLTTPKLLHLQCKGKELREINHMIHKNLIPEARIEETKPDRRGAMQHRVLFVNRRGVMMGDPLTKIVLTASSYSAWRMTRYSKEDNFLRFIYPKIEPDPMTTVRTYACAGDDHLGIGSRDDLLRIPKVMESMGYEISWDKYNINKRFVSYCQLYGMLPDHALSKEKRRQGMQPKQIKMIHIDTPKLRCCTQFQKMGGSENFDKPDPLIGKARMLANDVVYMKETLELAAACEWENSELQRFFNRLRFYIMEQTNYVRLLMPSWMEWKVFKDPMTYLHPDFGGIGLTVPGGLDIKNYEPAAELARKFSYMKENPTWSDSAVEWERGITVTNVIVNRLITETDLKTKSQSEVYDEAGEVLSRRSFERGETSSIGKHARWKYILEEYTCLDNEIPLVTSKDNVYVTLAIHPQKPQVSRKMRSRQVNGSIRKKLSKVEVPDDYVFEWKKPKSSARFIKTSILTDAFDTNFVRPSLKISKAMFRRGSSNGPTYVQNVEEVRSKTELGSFQIDLDESHDFSHTPSLSSAEWD
jgi:hypothetical protein